MAVFSALVTILWANRLDPKRIKYRLSTMPLVLLLRNRSNHSFYCTFIPNFSTIASSLTDLTKNGRPNNVKVCHDHHEKSISDIEE